MGFLLSLQVVRGETVLGQHTFDSDTHRLIRVGQRPNDQLPIQDPTVQVRARITLSPHAATLTDLGTSCGIVVNGTRIREAQLRPNDDIAIGSTRLLVTACASSYATPLAAASPPLPPSPRSTDATGEAERRLRVIGKVGTLPAGVLAQAEAFVDALMTGNVRPGAPPQVGTTTEPQNEPVPSLPDQVTIRRPATPWSDSSEPMTKAPTMSSPGLPAVSQTAPTKQSAGRSIFTPGKPVTGPWSRDGTAESLAADFTHQTSLDQSDAVPVEDPTEPSPQRERYDTRALVTTMRGRQRRNRALVGGVVVVAAALTVLAVVRRTDDAGAMTGGDDLSAFVAPRPEGKEEPAQIAPLPPLDPDRAEGAAAESLAEPRPSQGAAAANAAGAVQSAPTAAGAGAAPNAAPAMKDSQTAPAPLPAPVPAPSSPEATVDHRLSAATSLPDLARALWGNPDNAALIAEQNDELSTDGTLIPSGTTVKIPTSTLYTVKAGDTLGLIAEEFLGDPLDYRLIYAANKDTMSDPSDIAVGSTLVIPLLPPEVVARLNDR